MCNHYRVMRRLLEAVGHCAATVGMCINASETKVMSAFIGGKQRQAVLLDGEPIEDVDKFKYLGSMFITNSQDTEEIKCRIHLARLAFSRLQSCLCSRRKISLRTKSRVYRSVRRSILLYSCEAQPVRVANEKVLVVFDNGSNHPHSACEAQRLRTNGRITAPPPSH